MTLNINKQRKKHSVKENGNANIKKESKVDKQPQDTKRSKSLGTNLPKCVPEIPKFEEIKDEILKSNKKEIAKQCPFQVIASKRLASGCHKSKSIGPKKTLHDEIDIDIEIEFDDPLVNTTPAKLPDNRKKTLTGSFVKPSSNLQNTKNTTKSSHFKVDRDETNKKLKEKKDTNSVSQFNKHKVPRETKKLPTINSGSSRDRQPKEELKNVRKPKTEIKGKQYASKPKQSTYAMKHSERMLSDARTKKCQELFLLLDPDGCGIIRSGHIRLEYLSSKALETLEPALIAMDNKKLSLNYEIFCAIVEPLLRKLSLSQLRELVAGPKVALDAQLHMNFDFTVH